MSILYLFCTFLIKNSFLLFSHKVCDHLPWRRSAGPGKLFLRDVLRSLSHWSYDESTIKR